MNHGQTTHRRSVPACTPPKAGGPGRPIRRPAAVLLAVLLAGPVQATGQSLEGPGMVPAGLLLRQLDGVKRVLMIGAHPDDEDTAFLTVLARDRGVETAYLSLTRGDGGQNLIGPELFEGLGVIRTGELEAARRLDGGVQFFTRAFDFGYSKTSDESLTFWPHDEVLRDVVWVIRSFRPHVIVSVWTGTTRDGHGQHTASGILAREGFAAAGDPTRYPDQLDAGVEAWAPAKLFQTQRRNPSEATVLLDAGTLDPLLGRSAYQLAMDSRSQHRSQDMGASQPPGPRSTGASLEETRVSGSDNRLWDGIDTTLVGLAGLASDGRAADVRAHLTAYRADLERARAGFGLDRDALSGPLASAVGHLRLARDAAGPDAGLELRNVLDRRIEQATDAWLAAAGVVVDVRAADDLVVPGQTVAVEVQLWNGGTTALADVDAALGIPPGWVGRAITVEGVEPDGSVPPGRLATWQVELEVPATAAPSQPYFLRQPRDGAMYVWPDEPHLWGLPRDPSPVDATLSFSVAAGGSRTLLEAAAPWRYVGVDQARGEFTRPVLVVPAVSARVAPGSLVWPAGRSEPALVTVAVRSEAPDPIEGQVHLEAPEGWRVSPAVHAVSLGGPGAERSVVFEVSPTGVVATGEQFFRAAVTRGADRWDRTVSLIDYEHIDRTVMVEPAQARFTVVPVRVAQGLRVGYVMGTGDDGPEALRQMGAEVTLLDADAVREGAFDAFDVLVLGVRAYETRDDLLASNAQVLDFARAGGTVVLQYNQYQFARGDYAPYPLDIGRPADRVADETAEVRILHPEAPVFTSPNRIGPADFEGWVQERGLYFLGEWDDRYVPLIEMNDPGEEPKHGSLLVAPVGEGLYVYAALSFFRQWSSGVPGAYRLFANIVSLDAGEWARFRAQAAGN